MSFAVQAKIIACIELTICCIGIAILVVGGIVYAIKEDDLMKDTDKLDKHPNLQEFLESSDQDKAMAFAIPGLYLIIELILAIILWLGVTQGKPGLIKTWLVSSVIMVVAGSVFTVFGILASKNKQVPIMISIIGYSFTAYSIFVGFSLYKEDKVAPA